MQKPGYKTTEFWLTVLAMGGGFTLGYRGESETIALALIAAPQAFYALSRGISKMQNGVK